MFCLNDKHEPIPLQKKSLYLLHAIFADDFCINYFIRMLNLKIIWT